MIILKIFQVFAIVLRETPFLSCCFHFPDSFAWILVSNQVNFLLPFSWFAVGSRWPASSLQENEVRAYREIQRLNMNKILIEYLFICRQMGVLTLSSFLRQCDYLLLGCF
jgi:hypothetical protein